MMPSSSVKGFEGVSNIVRFNWGYYLLSALAFGAAILILSIQALPWWFRTAALCGCICLVFWTCSSLLVSWYVYDVAGVMRWEWIRDRLQLAPRRWANVHAGLDQSTASLQRLFPGSEGAVIDIYDPKTMTEPSIARARRLYPSTEPFQPGQTGSLPLPNTDRDTVFLLFAAHEVRAVGDRTQLLRETSRVLNERGRVVMVEHLRDLPNFLAFGPGFLHFHSGRSWRDSIRKAGLQIEQQSRLTPFVRCFVLRKADA
jgi:ubiquinone/menaquinone biosynthesis C-methylase UbiE